MIKVIILFIAILTVSMPSVAETTGKGKIVFTQGHTSPNCRTVLHKANGTGVQKYFRIADVPGNDDVQSIMLAALMAKRDVNIFYEPGQTTGCGEEPRIVYVTVY